MMRSIQEPEEQEHTDTEITLGMRSLLGVFFGLVLICGVFFGFGYSLGRGNSGSSKPSTPPSRPVAKTAAPKPAILPMGEPKTNEDDSSPPTTYTPGPDAREPAATSPRTPKPSASVIKPVTAESADSTLSTQPKRPSAIGAGVNPAAGLAATASPALAASPPSTTAQPSTPTMVQIAAVSRQEDADVLVAALKKRGYNVIVRNESRDSLLHVQIGPFATRDEAKAMRSKLLADGYNAILK
jgi:DedD protein